MPSALLSATARGDLLSPVRWISKNSNAAAAALQARVRVLLDKLGRHPDLGAARPQWAHEGYRFATRKGFPYLVIYNSLRRPPVVMRILHGAQGLPEILTTLPPLRE